MNRRLLIRVLIPGFVVLLATAAMPSRAATFLFIEGVPGESTDKDHRDWIDLVNFGQTLEPAKRRHSTVCEGIALKELDAASPALWSAVASKTVFPEMVLEITAESGESRITVLRQTMLNVRVSRVRFGERDQVPIEHVALAPEEISVLYRKVNPDGSIGDEVTGFVDCRER